MKRNYWTSSEMEVLNKLEAKLVSKGVPEHQARFLAEDLLEKRIDEAEERRLMSPEER